MTNEQMKELAKEIAENYTEEMSDRFAEEWKYAEALSDAELTPLEHEIVSQAVDRLVSFYGINSQNISNEAVSETFEDLEAV